MQEPFYRHANEDSKELYRILQIEDLVGEGENEEGARVVN